MNLGWPRMRCSICGVHNSTIKYESFSYDGAWIEEGFTRYYGYLGLLKTGIWSLNRYLNTLNHVFRDQYLQNIYKTSYDIPLTQVGQYVDQTGDIDYYNWVSARKAALVAYMLDKEINTITVGEKGLSDVMRYLYQEFGLKDKGYTNSDILETVNYN
jgi:predicted metalloprotease with PDZ domain